MEGTQLAAVDATAFVPRTDDIYIATYPRSGTTWMQMILYQLTTNGEMDFFHISAVVPFIERALRAGRSLEPLPSPRIFKTHLAFRIVGRWPGRYLYVARNGKDVLVSYFHFHRSHLGFTGTFPEFFEKFMSGQVQFGSWFKHVADWRAHADDPNVLFLNYEDLVTNFDHTLQRIVTFCDLQIPPQRWPAIRERCTFAFMRQHEDKFDHTTEIAWELLQTRSQGSFLRRGGSNAWKDQLSDEQVRRFDDVAGSWLGRSG